MPQTMGFISQGFEKLSTEVAQFFLTKKTQHRERCQSYMHIKLIPEVQGSKKISLSYRGTKIYEYIEKEDLGLSNHSVLSSLPPGFQGQGLHFGVYFILVLENLPHAFSQQRFGTRKCSMPESRLNVVSFLRSRENPFNRQIGLKLPPEVIPNRPQNILKHPDYSQAKMNDQQQGQSLHQQRLQEELQHDNE